MSASLPRRTARVLIPLRIRGARRAVFVPPVSVHVASVLVGSALFALGAWGCGGGAGRRGPVAAEAIAARPPLGPLAPLVPSGARAVFVVRPSVVAASPSFARLLDAVLLPGAFDRFAARTGVDLRTLSEAVYADFGDRGALWLARGPIDAPAVVREAGARMAIIESQSDDLFVRRAGFFTGGRREVVALAPDVLVVTEGPAIEPLATLLACAASRTRRCPSSFSGSDAAALFTELGEAPLVVHAPTGVELPEQAGLAVLLAGTRALALAVDVASPEDGRLALRASLRGRFPADVADNFRVWFRAVGSSELGATLGLDEAASRLEVTPDATGLRLDTSLELTRLARGLRVLFSAELEELLAPDPPAASAPRSSAPTEPGGVSLVDDRAHDDGVARHAVALRAASARACES